MSFNRWSRRDLLVALTCVAWATAPGCGGDGDDEDPSVLQNPSSDPVSVWEVQLSEGAKSLIGVAAVDANHAWALSTLQLFRTQDGGATWSSVETNLSEIQFVDPSNGWAIESGDALSTSDGGETWTVRFSLPPTPGMWLGAMSFVSATTGWVAEYHGGAFFRTTDGGATWMPVELPPGSIPILKFLDARNGFVRMKSAEGSKLYATTDGGETWEERLHVEYGSHLDRFDAVSVDVIWAAVRHGSGSPPCEVLRTNDGGATWSSVVFEGVGLVSDLDFVSEAEGWVVAEAAIYHSSDGGETWTVQEAPEIPGGPYVYNGFSHLAMVDATTGWIVGSVGNTISGGKGIILNTTSGGE